MRTEAWARKGYIDPVRLGKRPLAEILGDEIPYQRWQRENNLIKRAGFKDRQHYLRIRWRG